MECGNGSHGLQTGRSRKTAVAGGTADSWRHGREITRKPISRHGWSPRQGDAQRFSSEPEARAAANAVEQAVRRLGLCQVMEVA